MKSSFTIYSASAGSGKTYTLAKTYIKLLIDSKNNEYFKSILAITFTNKAVGEMKTRIIDMLKLFSADDYLVNPHSMFTDICDELDVSAEVLHEKSKIVLKKIIHNYGAFDVSTIDAFTHRVIRTFAFDLKLPINFEVELDQYFFLTKAVDSLLTKAGYDKNLTKVLVDFAIEKADNDKSWDISKDIFKVGKFLLSENDLPYIKDLKKKTFADFKNLKISLKQSISDIESKIVTEAKSILTLIDESGLEHSDFDRSYLPKHFLKLTNANFNVSFTTEWQIKLLDGQRLYPKRVAPQIGEIIDTIQTSIAKAFDITKTLVFEVKFKKEILKNITPSSVLTALQKELDQLKIDENKILISEFNTIISNEIKNQPTPFIYERLGEKFRHYFIDEFQDTSKMQWANLIPLIDNALSSSDGSAMLVGDAKQSIYRWRGGDAIQFIDLYTKKFNPFQVEPKLNNLNTNYRSYKEIVNFNNLFFNYISDSFFHDNSFSELYKDAHQNTSKNDGGYVNLSFLEFNDADERTNLYCQKTLNIVTSCVDSGYDLKDICVLVRKKKEGFAVSDYLTSHNINIISSETLLLINSPKVQLLNLVLELLIKPKDQKLKLNVLNGISELFEIINKHHFFSKYLRLSIAELFENLSDFGTLLNYSQLIQLSLYELVEELVRGFKLCSLSSDAYVQFYLDTVFEYSQKEASDILGFLDYFNSKKESLTVAVPSNIDAVSVMTIHKSKGLEFPVVVFPFADLDIYYQLEPKAWFPLEAKNYCGFEHALLNYSRAFENFGDTGEAIYNYQRSYQEFDNINLLYVTLTRAIEQLYIISKRDINSKNEVNSNTYSGLFISFLMAAGIWNSEENVYCFGENFKTYYPKNTVSKIEKISFISTPKESHALNIVAKSGVLWNSEKDKAINYGNTVHLILSRILTEDDIVQAVKSTVDQGLTESSKYNDYLKKVTLIVTHPSLRRYFTEDYTIFNEKEIITAQGDFIRPDRLVIKGNDAILIDYKTGGERPKHRSQINFYADSIEDMNYSVQKKLLVYINNDIKIIEV